MTPKPLHVPLGLEINPGDVVTIEGIWNRPAATTLRWWAMLIFHPARACRHLGWLWPRMSQTSPLECPPISRRMLFEKRQLQKFRVQP